MGVFLGEQGWQDDTQAALLYAFSQSAQELGYMTLSGRVGDFDTPTCSRTVREVLCSGCVDAGVFLNASGGDLLIRQLLREGQTIGALGLLPDMGHERLFTIGLDTDIARDTVLHALSLGHRRAVLLGDSAGAPDGGKLLERFLETAANAGLYAYRPPQGSAMDGARQAAVALDQRDRPRLLVCADLASVYAAYRAVNERGLVVGRDVSILGMGLIPSALPLWPALAAFRFDPNEMITSLANRMIRSMEGASGEPRHVEIVHQWQNGDSCTRYTA